MWDAIRGRKAMSFGSTAYVGGNNVVWVDDNWQGYLEKGYGGNDVVYSIVNQCAEKERMAPWQPYKIKDESSLKRLNIELQKAGTPDFNFKLCLDLRTKALEIYTGDGKLNELLQWPNEEETFSDLVANSGAYKRLTGNRFIYNNSLSMGANAGKPGELILLPSDCMAVTFTRGFPVRKTGYQLTHETIIKLELEQVLHDKTWNPNNQIPGQALVGMAPLKAANMLLTRNRSNKTMSTKAFQNMGPEVIAFLEDQRITADQAIEQINVLKKNIYEEGSGPQNRKKVAVSGYKTGVVKLGDSVVDMDALNLEKWDVVMFANVFNFPHILLIPEHSTLDNLKVAEKALISRCCLPYLNSFRNHFNRMLQKHWGYENQNIFVDYDLSVYAELQPDKKEIADWTSRTPVTIRQTFEALQIELPQQYANDPMVDKIFITPGKVPLEDYELPELDNEDDV